MKDFLLSTLSLVALIGTAITLLCGCNTYTHESTQPNGYCEDNTDCDDNDFCLQEWCDVDCRHVERCFPRLQRGESCTIGEDQCLAPMQCEPRPHDPEDPNTTVGICGGGVE